MSLQTRKPTGKPAWPMLLLAGAAKAGKSYAAAQASASDLIDRTLWLTVGETEPDEYGPLGRFEIVQQDGTHRALLDAITEIQALPTPTGKPHLIVLDSISQVWTMLSDEAQETANARARRKAQRTNRPAPEGDVSIGMDLWNKAASRWRQLMDALRAHSGPVILTARLAEVAVVEGGEPTGAKTWKIEGHKTLPFDCTATVEMRSRSERYLTRVTSLRWVAPPDELVAITPDMGIEDLWRKLGIEDATNRSHTYADGAQSLRADDATREALLKRLAVVGDMARLDEHWRTKHDEPIAEATNLDALRALVEIGEAKAAERATTPTEPERLVEAPTDMDEHYQGDTL